MSNNHNQFLDESNIADPDQILLSIFKSTATTVTQLYKESLNQSTKSYKNGYKQCLLDLMHFASLQQHQRNLNTNTGSPGNRIALTFDELMTFYNNKQNQLNELEENSSSQNLSHSNSMSNDEEEPEAPSNNPPVTNDTNDNYYEKDTTLPELPEPSALNLPDTDTMSGNVNNRNTENEIKPNLSGLKSNINFSKGFTFRFNNDQLSPNFTNHDNMKRRFGNVPNTINFFGRTYNFNNFENVTEPPFKRNRWRKDDRMLE